MALVTYILLAALHSGLQSRFHPEILGVTASTAIVVVLLDFAIVKKAYTSIEADGAIAVKTKQAILVGEYAAPVQAGEATTVVEGLADYLIGVGY